MSAIKMMCEACGGRYIAGVVGSTPWPAHECPNRKPLPGEVLVYDHPNTPKWEAP